MPNCLHLGSGLFAVEVDGRAHIVTQPKLHYDRGRGESQDGLIYDRDVCSFCALTGRMVDDMRSWHMHQYMQEEADREKDAELFVRFRKEDVVWSS